MVMDRIGICKVEGDLKIGKCCFKKDNEVKNVGTNINDGNELKADVTKRLHSDDVCF